MRWLAIVKVDQGDEPDLKLILTGSPGISVCPPYIEAITDRENGVSG
jgi:hypothetical protein